MAWNTKGEIGGGRGIHRRRLLASGALALLALSFSACGERVIADKADEVRDCQPRNGAAYAPYAKFGDVPVTDLQQLLTEAAQNVSTIHARSTVANRTIKLGSTKDGSNHSVYISPADKTDLSIVFPRSESDFSDPVVSFKVKDNVTKPILPTALTCVEGTDVYPTDTVELLRVVTRETVAFDKFR